MNLWVVWAAKDPFVVSFIGKQTIYFKAFEGAFELGQPLLECYVSSHSQTFRQTAECLGTLAALNAKACPRGHMTAR